MANKGRGRPKMIVPLSLVSLASPGAQPETTTATTVKHKEDEMETEETTTEVVLPENETPKEPPSSTMDHKLWVDIQKEKTKP